MTKVVFTDQSGFSTSDLIEKVLLSSKAIREGVNIYDEKGFATANLDGHGWSGKVNFMKVLDDFTYGDADKIPDQSFGAISFYKNDGSATYGIGTLAMSFYELMELSTASQVIQYFFSRDDIFKGSGSSDRIEGYGGDDNLSGYEGNDRLYGDSGNDTLYGMSGADRLFGGAGRDKLDGGSGRDTLNGGIGRDKLSGGSGADVFVFTSAKESPVTASGRDTISDFNRSQGDKIDLRGIDANPQTEADSLFRFIASNKFHHKAGELRYEKSGESTLILGDLDGDGNADFSIFLEGRFNLQGTDFLL